MRERAIGTPLAPVLLEEEEAGDKSVGLGLIGDLRHKILHPLRLGGVKEGAIPSFIAFTRFIEYTRLDRTQLERALRNLFGIRCIASGCSMGIPTSIALIAPPLQKVRTEFGTRRVRHSFRWTGKGLRSAEPDQAMRQSVNPIRRHPIIASDAQGIRYDVPGGQSSIWVDPEGRRCSWVGD